MPTAMVYEERCLAHENGSMLLDPLAASWLEVAHAERPERVARAFQVLERSGVAGKLERAPGAPCERRGAAAGPYRGARRADSRRLRAGRARLGRSGRRGSGPIAGTPRCSRPAALWRPWSGSWSAVRGQAPTSSRAPRATTPRPTRRWASASSTTSPWPPAAPSSSAASGSRSSTGTSTTATAPKTSSSPTRRSSSSPCTRTASIRAGRGRAEDRGTGEGVGTTLNLPLPAGSGDAVYLRAIEQQVVPALRDFDPDLILALRRPGPGRLGPAGADERHRRRLPGDDPRSSVRRPRNCARAESSPSRRAATASTTCRSASSPRSRRWRG